jgi:hypothetical protein
MDLLLDDCVREPIKDPILNVCVREPIMDLVRGDGQRVSLLGFIRVISVILAMMVMRVIRAIRVTSQDTSLTALPGTLAVPVSWRVPFTSVCWCVRLCVRLS